MRPTIGGRGAVVCLQRRPSERITMTTTAGSLLVNRIAPLIAAAIMRGAVKPAVGEDCRRFNRIVWLKPRRCSMPQNWPAKQYRRKALLISRFKRAEAVAVLGVAVERM